MAKKKDTVKSLAHRLAGVDNPFSAAVFETGLPKALEPIVKRLGSQLPADHPSRKLGLHGDLKMYLENCIPKDNSIFALGGMSLLTAASIAQLVEDCELTPVGLALGFFPLGAGNGYPHSVSMHDSKLYELGTSEAETPQSIIDNSTCHGTLAAFLKKSIESKQG